MTLCAVAVADAAGPDRLLGRVGADAHPDGRPHRLHTRAAGTGVPAVSPPLTACESEGSSPSLYPGGG